MCEKLVRRKEYYRTTNTLQFSDVLVLSSPKCFGQSCDLLQGDFFDKKNTVVIEVCLNHSTVLKIILFLFKIHS